MISFINKNNVYSSSGNSSSQLLGANEVFTGEITDIEEYVKVVVTINVDVESAVNGFVIQFSNDKENWISTARTIVLNEVNGIYGGIYFNDSTGKYMRIIYTNGPVVQGFFVMRTVLKRIEDNDNMITPISSMNKFQNATAVRIVSDFKKDVALGLIDYNKNFNVNGVRLGGVDTTETIIGSISSQSYQWPNTAQRLRIKAGGSINDIISGTGARIIQINGLNSNYDEISELVYTNGVNVSLWTTHTYIRVNSVITVNSGSQHTNDGLIIIENETDNYELSAICSGHGRALIGIYTIPRGHSCVITRVLFMTGSNYSATLKGYFKEYNTQTNYIINIMPGLSGVAESTQQNYVKFNEKTDFWTTAKKDTGTGNAEVSIIFELDILKST